MTTQNIHKRHTSMLLAEFESAIPSSELSQTHALDHAAETYLTQYKYLALKKPKREKISRILQVWVTEHCRFFGPINP
jgi:hypothetical protein